MNFDTDASPHLKKELNGFEKNNGSFVIRIEGAFESAHYLYKYLQDGSDEPVHGHSWQVQIYLMHKSKALQTNGISFDFLAVRKRLDEMLERIDHVCINDLSEFKNINPTTENIALWFYQGLHKIVEENSGIIKEVRVFEGKNNLAIYNP